MLFLAKSLHIRSTLLLGKHSEYECGCFDFPSCYRRNDLCAVDITWRKLSAAEWATSEQVNNTDLYLFSVTHKRTNFRTQRIGTCAILSSPPNENMGNSTVQYLNTIIKAKVTAIRCPAIFASITLRRHKYQNKSTCKKVFSKLYDS